MTDRILVWRAHHGPRYYKAGNDAEWAQSCVTILREKLDEGYVYQPEAPEDRPYFFTEELSEAVGMTPEQVDSLPDTLRDQVRDLRKRYQDAQRDHQFAVLEYEEIQRVVKENDVSFQTFGRGERATTEPLAWGYLNKRYDYEDESVTLESIS